MKKIKLEKGQVLVLSELNGLIESSEKEALKELQNGYAIAYLNSDGQPEMVAKLNEGQEIAASTNFGRGALSQYYGYYTREGDHLTNGHRYFKGDYVKSLYTGKVGCTRSQVVKAA